MSKGKKQDNFIMQAGILAMAGIISRIIGLLYRGPLHSVIGAEGLGYYSSAYNFYSIVLLISSYSIPSAISKVIAQKLAKKEYRNAHRLFLCSLGYVLVVGAAGGLFLFFGAGLMASPEAVPVLQVFAPTIFVYGILGVLRGYFQAHNSMAQTSVSQIFEQIANAVVSVGAAYLLINTMMGTMDVPADAAGKTTRAIYGAMGSAMGTGVGVLIALLFMLGIYGLNRKMIHKRIARDRHEQVDSYGQILKTITMVVTPFILSTAINNLSGTVNNVIYTKAFPEMKDVSSAVIHYNWGVFSQALTISNIPIAFATAMGAAMIPTVAKLIASEEVEAACRKIALAIKSIMILSIPCAVGIFVLGKPITGLLFASASGEELDMAGKMLMALSVSVVFYALSTLNSTILQGLGKVNTPIINASVALVIQTVTAVVLLFFTNMDVYGIAIANTLYGAIIGILNQISVRKAVGYRQEYLKTFLAPFLASVLMGAAAWAVYEVFYMLTESVRISVIPALAAAIPTYFVMLLLMRGITEEELKAFPKGHLLVKVAKKCRLMK